MTNYLKYAQGIFQADERFEKNIESVINLNSLLENEPTSEIHDQQQAIEVLSLAMQARKIFQELEDDRLQVLTPYTLDIKSVTDAVRNVQNKLGMLEQRLHNRLGLWMLKLAENPFTLIEKLASGNGTIVLEDYWDYEIVDEQMIPREYLEVDYKSLDKAVRYGARTIPGVKIRKKTKTRMRLKNVK